MEKFNSSRRVLRFGVFEADLHARELRKNGLKIRLQDQPFHVLTLLLESPGKVLTREELRQKLWPVDTFVDFDNSLGTAINKIREALGDSAENPRFIETLPRRGYRFLESIDGAREASSKHDSPIDSIAVLKFENTSTEADTEYLASGIPGSIIHSLSQVPKLRVVALSSISRDEDGAGDPLAIGRKFNVRTVLLGRIWQRANKLRLHVDLVDTESGEELWGDQYDRELAELFAMQDEISQEISRKLRLKMTGENERRLTRRYTDDIEAYQLCIRGRRCCEQRTPESFKKGIEYLSQAIQKDPGYALAHAELAQCLSVPSYYGSVDPRIAYPRARMAALRALEIDDKLAEGHEVLATILQNYDWDWTGSEREYKRAIELNPNYPIARFHYAWHLTQHGQFDAAIDEAREGLIRDPMSGVMNAGFAWVLVNARKFDRCIDQCLTTIDVDPNLALCYMTLGTAYEQKGMYPDAVVAYEKGIALGAGVALQKAMLGHAYALSGDGEKAREILRELQELAKNTYVPALDSVIVYDGLQEKQLAIDFLQKACENRDTLIVCIRSWPQFDNLRDDPRFQEIERRIGLRK